jgi:hypothetical protein
LIDVNLSQSSLVSKEQVFYLAALEILPIPWDDTHSIRIDGYRIDPSDDEIGLLNLSRPTGPP